MRQAGAATCVPARSTSSLVEPDRPGVAPAAGIRAGSDPVVERLARSTPRWAKPALEPTHDRRNRPSRRRAMSNRSRTIHTQFASDRRCHRRRADRFGSRVRRRRRAPDSAPARRPPRPERHLRRGDARLRLMRPARFADKANLHRGRSQGARRVLARQPGQGFRAQRPEPRGAAGRRRQVFFVPVFNGAAGGVGGYNASCRSRHRAFQIDGTYRTSIIVDPPERSDGRRDSGRSAGPGGGFTSSGQHGTPTGCPGVGPYDDPEQRPLGERCLLGFGSARGPPMLPVMYNNLKRIVQTEDIVMILVEMNQVRA